MKVIKLFFLSMLLGVFNFKNIYKPSAMEKLDYTYLKDEMIRFHFLSNSDSENDQFLKNKVKDEVLSYLNKNVDLKGSKQENLHNLIKNVDNIKKIAQNTLKSYGSSQDVEIQIKEKYFNKRIYEDVIIPEGVYDSFILYIGEGKGKNFWSMLFSSIGFIHSDNHKNSMIDVVRYNKKEMEVSSLGSKHSKVKVSSKVFEVVRDIFQKIF